MTLVPTSFAARAMPFFALLRDAGVSVESSVERAGIPVSFTQDPGLVMPAHVIGQFIVDAAEANDINDVAFRGAREESLSTLEQSIQNKLTQAVTLADMLERYYQIAHGYSSYRQLRTIVRGNMAQLVSHGDERLIDGAWMRISEWSNVMLLIAIVRHVVGDGFQPCRISLQSRDPVSRLAQDSFPNTEISTGCRTTFIALPLVTLAERLPCCSRKARVEDDGLPQPTADFADQIQRLIEPYLSQTDFNVAQAAEISGESLRSFQRRLAAQGTSYRTVVGQARASMAMRLLEEEACPIIEVAHLAGYSDPANFARAFRRFAGMSPREYRRSRPSLQ